MDSTFDGSVLDLAESQRGAFRYAFFQSFVQVNHHHHSGFHRDSKQSDIANPDRNAEVVSQQPLQQQAAADGVGGGQNEDDCLSDRMKDHVQ